AIYKTSATACTAAADCAKSGIESCLFTLIFDSVHFAFTWRQAEKCACARICRGEAEPLRRLENNWHCTLFDRGDHDRCRRFCFIKPVPRGGRPQYCAAHNEKTSVAPPHAAGRHGRTNCRCRYCAGAPG